MRSNAHVSVFVAVLISARIFCAHAAISRVVGPATVSGYEMEEMMEKHKRMLQGNTDTSDLRKSISINKLGQIDDKVEQILQDKSEKETHDEVKWHGQVVVESAGSTRNGMVRSADSTGDVTFSQAEFKATQREKALNELKSMSEKMNNDTMEAAKMKAQEKNQGGLWHTVWRFMTHSATPRAKRKQKKPSNSTNPEQSSNLAFEDFFGWFLIWGGFFLLLFYFGKKQKGQQDEGAEMMSMAAEPEKSAPLKERLQTSAADVSKMMSNIAAEVVPKPQSSSADLVQSVKLDVKVNQGYSRKAKT